VLKNYTSAVLLVFTEFKIKKLNKRRLQVGIPADYTGSLDRVIGSGCLRTSHNADNVVIVYWDFCVLQGSVSTDQVRWKMNTPRTISDILPSTCQNY